MDKHKGIEEIKTVLLEGHKYFDTEIDKGVFDKTYISKDHNKTLHDILAETLFAKGYGNVKQAVKEFAEKLRQGLLNRAICRQDYFQVMSDLQFEIDNLIKELGYDKD